MTDEEIAGMVATSGPVERRSPGMLIGSQELSSSPASAFALICEVEKWPVWLSFAKTVRRVDEGVPLGLGSEVAVRCNIPGEPEELYEVDQFLDGYIVSLVGAYSLRRRIDFRIERKGERAKMVLRIDYPTYGGVFGSLIDRMTARRRLDRAVEESLVHFKGLVEYRDAPEGAVLADF